MPGNGMNDGDWRPCAVSLRSLNILAAPPAAARVLGVTPAAVYLYLEDDGTTARRPEPGVPDAHSRRVIPLLTDSAVLLPSGIRVGRLSWPSRLTAGDPATIGENRILLPGLGLHMVRTWRPSRVHVGVPRPMPDLIGSVDPGLRQAAATLVTTALSGADPEVLVRALLGRGRGLTPTGDDVLCGVLLALRAAAPAEPAADSLRMHIARRWAATTSLSALLLRDASDGYAVPELAHLVDHLYGAATGPPPVGLLARVLNIGHTSGADLLAGVLGAGDALNDIVGPARPNDHQQVHGKALISEGAF